MKSPDPGSGLRFLFAGSPAIALPSFRMIAEGALAGKWTLAGVLTNPDKRRSRKGQAEATELGRAAAEIAGEFNAVSLPPPVILKADTLKAPEREALAALKPDLLVSFAYGRIFGPKFLDLFPLGGINVHPSLLPKYRGASPIQAAILNRDTLTGVTVQRLALEMDSGNILARKEIQLTGRETADALTESAALAGAELLQMVLEKCCTAPAADRASLLEGIPQQGEPGYCTLIKKDAGVIDWSRSAVEIDAHIRAYNPWPLARTGHGGQILNILEAAPWWGSISAIVEPWFPATEPRFSTGEITEPGRVLGIDPKSGILIQTGSGVLSVSLLQYQTKKALPWKAFLNGARNFTGSRLTGGF
jgi:methionyl-tRNA formyltransferase